MAGSAGLVMYVFAGYPALLALMSRLCPRPLRTEEGFTPPLSLVIVAFDEEDCIEDKLRNVAALDYPAEHLDVVVVTDGSSDRTVERARAFPGVRVLHDPQRGGNLAALNRGIYATSTDLVVLSDANNRYVRGALRAVVAPLADPSVGMVTGAKTIDDADGRTLDRAEGLYWRYESKVKQWESATGSVVGVCGEILALRRAAYSSPAPGTLNDDFVQAMLMALDGWRVVYAPEAISVEHASATIGDEAARRARMTTGRMQAMRQLLPRLIRQPRLAWQVISHKGLRPLVPWALTSTAACTVALARRPGWPRAVLLAQVAFCAAAEVGRRDDRAGRRRRFTYLPFYFCRMNAATIAGARNFCTGRYSPLYAKVRRG